MPSASAAWKRTMLNPTAIWRSGDLGIGAVSETRKLAAILVSGIVGYSRLAGADEDRTLARLRGLRSDLIDPAIAAHHGRIIKRTGDGSIIEFRSVVGRALRDRGVVARLASSLGWALIYAEAEKGGRSKNPDVIDLTMRGWSLLYGGTHLPPKEFRDQLHEARTLFDGALQIDPNAADALAGSAHTYFLDYFFGWGEPGTDYEAKALGQADRAIALDPNNVRAYFAKASYLALSRRPSEALGAADAGLAVNSNYAQLYLPRTVAENSLGRYEQAKSDAEQAMRLSPQDPLAGTFHVIVATRRSTAVISTWRSQSIARRSIRANPGFSSI
jgi:hypothetical protein